MKTKLFIVIALAITIVSLSGCGTIQGFGSDLQWVGEVSGDFIDGNHK